MHFLSCGLKIPCPAPSGAVSASVNILDWKLEGSGRSFQSDVYSSRLLLSPEFLIPPSNSKLWVHFPGRAWIILQFKKNKINIIIQTTNFCYFWRLCLKIWEIWLGSLEFFLIFFLLFHSKSMENSVLWSWILDFFEGWKSSWCSWSDNKGKEF